MATFKCVNKMKTIITPLDGEVQIIPERYKNKIKMLSLRGVGECLVKLDGHHHLVYLDFPLTLDFTINMDAPEKIECVTGGVEIWWVVFDE